MTTEMDDHHDNGPPSIYIQMVDKRIDQTMVPVTPAKWEKPTAGKQNNSHCHCHIGTGETGRETPYKYTKWDHCST